MSKRKKILVTGAGSQLGKTLRILNDNGFKYDFRSKYMLDISDPKELNRFLAKNKYDYCFNFAAYTAVNLAETDRAKCFDVNVRGVANLSKAAKKHDFTLIHISSDYVFDGKQDKPYTETDPTHPLNYYGKTKRLGEQIIQQYLNKYLIIRTSWLYSDYNNNFVKTILKMAQEGQKVKIVQDQIGTPTYTKNLIRFILTAIKKTEKSPELYGLYHFSDKGEASWYDFGKEVYKLTGIDKEIIPIKSTDFASPAKRPHYSVLSKRKAEQAFGVRAEKWQDALKDCFAYK